MFLMDLNFSLVLTLSKYQLMMSKFIYGCILSENLFQFLFSILHLYFLFVFVLAASLLMIHQDENYVTMSWWDLSKTHRPVTLLRMSFNCEKLENSGSPSSSLCVWEAHLEDLRIAVTTRDNSPWMM